MNADDQRALDGRTRAVENPAAVEQQQVAKAHLPRPTIWPAACALSLSLLLFGLVTSPWFMAFGAALLGIAIAGWIGELRNDAV